MIDYAQHLWHRPCTRSPRDRFAPSTAAQVKLDRIAADLKHVVHFEDWGAALHRGAHDKRRMAQPGAARVSRLQLRKCSGLDAAGLAALLEGVPDVSVLDLGNCEGCDDACAQLLSAHEVMPESQQALLDGLSIDDLQVRAAPPVAMLVRITRASAPVLLLTASAEDSCTIWSRELATVLAAESATTNNTVNLLPVFWC